MSYMKKLQFTFIGIVVVSSILLAYNIISTYNFKHNPLSQDIIYKINKKEYELLAKIKNTYHINAKVPVEISTKMNNRLYGLCTLDQNNKIKIYLNKKMFQESTDYMIEDVLPHEYAHALMFMFNKTTNKNGGHTKDWQRICQNIGGVRCERFVDSNDIIISKRNIF